MLIFEYTRSFKVLPSSLINEAPAIWRWDNPYMGISDWMFDLYNIEASSTNGYSFCIQKLVLGTMSR